MGGTRRRWIKRVSNKHDMGFGAGGSISTVAKAGLASFDIAERWSSEVEGIDYRTHLGRRHFFFFPFLSLSLSRTLLVE